MTIVLFDIDGVLNPHLAWNLDPDSFKKINSGWASWQLNKTTHGVWMKSLLNSAEIVWASSWEAESNAVAEYYGISPLDYVKFRTQPTDSSETSMWKLEDVKKFLSKTTEPVIWLDDEFTAEANEWASHRPDTKLILCDPAEGWTENQYKEVLNFIDSHKKVASTFKSKLFSHFKR